jgi:hypothetical protein
MRNCGNKIKHTCSEKNYATCVYYELEVPSFSSLINEDCITLEETTEDQYNLIGGIKSEIDLSALGQDCINYGVNPKTVKSVLLKQEQEICNLKDRVNTLETTAICDMNITECGLTLPDNPCGGTFSTLGELLGYLLDNTTPPTP